MRPSALLGLSEPEDAYLAYCLDEAVAYVGSAIKAELESEMSEVEGRVNQERRAQAVLSRYFNSDDKPPTGQFADPALLFQ